MKILDSQGISWHTISIPTACSRVAWHHRTRQPMDGQKRRGARAEGEHLSYFQDLSGPFDLAANLAPAFFFENWGWVKTKKATHFPTAPRGMTIPGCTSSSRFRGGKWWISTSFLGCENVDLPVGTPILIYLVAERAVWVVYVLPQNEEQRHCKLSFPITWYYDVLRTWGHWIQKETRIADDLEWFVAIPGLRMWLKHIKTMEHLNGSVPKNKLFCWRWISMISRSNGFVGSKLDPRVLVLWCAEIGDRPKNHRKTILIREALDDDAFLGRWDHSMPRFGNFDRWQVIKNICNKHTTRIDKSDIVLVCGVCIYTYYIVVNAFTNY